MRQHKNDVPVMAISFALAITIALGDKLGLIS